VDVGEWLNSLGLGQYEAAFRENGVSEEDLYDSREILVIFSTSECAVWVRL
jgi:hypothetical protein